MAWHDGPKERTNPLVDAYIADQDEPQRIILERIRAIVKEDPDVVEGIAWGIPCYFRKGPYCYTSSAQRHITFGLFRGIEIHDPSGLLSGTGKSPVAKCVIKLKDGVPEEALRAWLEQAVMLDERGD